MDDFLAIFTAGLQARAGAVQPQAPPAPDAAGEPAAPREPTFKTFAERLARAYGDGLVPCGNTQHYAFDARGRGSMGCLVRPDEYILRLMPPYRRAECKCERDALHRYDRPAQPLGTYQDKYVMAGADFVGCTPKPENGVFKKVCPVPYQLTHEQQVALGKDFPNYVFYSTQTGHHDHPIAHTRTMIATAVLTQSLPVGTLLDPALCIDVYGNPASNRKNNAAEPRRVIETCCKVVSPKDAYRAATKWGPEVVDGVRRWHNLMDREIGAQGSTLGPERMAQCQRLVSIHTAYYLDHSEVWKMLQRCRPGARFTALMHKFGDKASGTVNGGEQAWTRKDGMITQTNVDSRESYTHADTDARWFSKYSWNSGNRGLTWTAHYVTGDMWIIDACQFSPQAIGMFTPGQPELAPPPPPTLKSDDPFDAAVIVRDECVPLTRDDGSTVSIPVPARLATTFVRLHKSVIGKPRDATQWKSHVGRANLYVKDLLVKSEIECNGQELLALCQASFWAGARYDVASASNLFNGFWETTVSGKAVFTYGAHAKHKSTLHKAIGVASAMSTSNTWAGRFGAIMVKVDEAIVAKEI